MSLRSTAMRREPASRCTLKRAPICGCARGGDGHALQQRLRWKNLIKARLKRGVSGGLTLSVVWGVLVGAIACHSLAYTYTHIHTRTHTHNTTPLYPAQACDAGTPSACQPTPTSVPSSSVCVPLEVMPRGQNARQDSLEGILMRYSSCMVPGPKPIRFRSAPVMRVAGGGT